jgi:hypothetical protein
MMVYCLEGMGTFCEAPGANMPSWGEHVKGACLVKGAGWAELFTGTTTTL